MAKYKVISKGSICVLREEKTAMDEIKRSLKKGENLEEKYPEAWVQDGWVNVVVANGQVLETGEYEPNILHKLYTDGLLELMSGVSKPTDSNKVDADQVQGEDK